MNITMGFMDCVYAFMACFGVCFVFNLRGKMMLFAPLGGALAWATYLLAGGIGNDLIQFFLATIVVSIYAEIMARVNKVPATGFLLVGLFPMVPGGGIYYTMEYCINGDIGSFVETGLHTFGIAGSLAMGVLLISSIVHLWNTIRSSDS